MKFDLILADPPWLNSAGSKKVEGHSADKYSGMSVEDLGELQVGSIACDDAYLFLWVDAQHHHRAPEVAKKWGFEKFATKLTWLKTNEDGSSPVGGIGRYTMIWSEDCWLFKRGNPKFVYTPEQNPFYAPRTHHSRKPDWLYNFIEKEHIKGKDDKKKITSFPTKRLELFARTHLKGKKIWNLRDGWTQIGNECEGTLNEDIKDSILDLYNRREIETKLFEEGLVISA